jgi:bifunctional oligoribonuclease and PAP phosphatase NrnA
MNVLSTLVYSEQDLAKAWDLVKKARSITLLTHHKPDQDAVSSCAALAHEFEKFDKKIEVIYPTQPETACAYGPKKVLINSHIQTPDVLIVCDTAVFSRCYYPTVFNNIPLINIDHHVGNSINGLVNLVNSDASSTCEELFVILEQLLGTANIDLYTKECLLAGIIGDSLCFQTQATTARTLRIVANIIDQGVNLFEVQRSVMANKTPNIIAFWGALLSNVQFLSSQKAARISVSK